MKETRQKRYNIDNSVVTERLVVARGWREERMRSKC